MAVHDLLSQEDINALLYAEENKPTPNALQHPPIESIEQYLLAQRYLTHKYHEDGYLHVLSIKTHHEEDYDHIRELLNSMIRDNELTPEAVQYTHNTFFITQSAFFDRTLVSLRWVFNRYFQDKLALKLDTYWVDLALASAHGESTEYKTFILDFYDLHLDQALTDPTFILLGGSTGTAALVIIDEQYKAVHTGHTYVFS